MGHQTASGATLAISLTAPASHDVAGWSALSVTLIGEITNIGEFGKQWDKVTHSPLSSRGVKKGKGSFDNGTLSPSLALDNNDAGQAEMKVALESDDPKYFILTLQDGSQYAVVGLVMSFKPNVGGVNDVVTVSTSIELTPDDILEIAA